MLTRNLIRIFVSCMICFFLFSCKTEEIILHGDIKGLVTDAETSEPLQGATVELIQPYVSPDTASSGNDGTYLLKSISPGVYDIRVSKYAYGESSKKNIKVEEAKTAEVNFSMSGVPIINISESWLDFGLDLISMKFVISNIGKRKLSYVINTSKDWITVNPYSGEINNGTDTIIVTIDRTGLSDSIIYKEKIDITSAGGPAPLQNAIDVYLNGVLDTIDLTYYKIVRIGTQTWMAENLNAGKKLFIETYPQNNDIPEKLCYHDEEINCEIYGGLYDWDEAMQYDPSDSGTIGSTQGICPEGYHMPTKKEWITLSDYLGGYNIAGGKLKETGTVHWLSPNTSATNEKGFTALPGGYIESGKAGIPVLYSYEIKAKGIFWTATLPPDAAPIPNYGRYSGYHVLLKNSSTLMEIKYYPDREIACSVRCIKDP
jgi:uncharacterized protein (TIGR02145 family)